MSIKRIFLNDLNSLLLKYNATLEVEDHWEGYPECGSDLRIVVDIPTLYDQDGECVRERISIDLGRYYDGR